MRAGEERLKAELREKEAEISSLRAGTLSALSSRQAAFDKRRLEAVDQLWSSYNTLLPARALVSSMALIKFEEASAMAENDPKTRKFFELLGSGFDFKAIDTSGSNKARPFVTPIVWAVFTAIQAVTVHSIMRWHVLKDGLGTKDFIDKEGIRKLIIAALPSYAGFLEHADPSSYSAALEALDAKLLTEIQSMLTGAEDDKASLKQAAEIIRQANALQTPSSSSPS